MNKTGFPPVKKAKLKKLKPGIKKVKREVKKEKIQIKKEKEESASPSSSTKSSPKTKATKSPKIVKKECTASPGGKESSSPATKDSSPCIKSASTGPSAGSKDNIKKRLKKGMRSSSESVRPGLVKRSTTLKSKNYRLVMNK